MMSIDHSYKKLGYQILNEGELRQTRNGATLSVFGTTLKHDLKEGLPLLSLRKIHLGGIIGEFKSFLENANTLKHFEANGCNYWKLWADPDGALRLDYPPKQQLDYVIYLLKNDPTSRRILIDLWNPLNTGKLSLDPCHTQYQFYVRNKIHLDMIWTQRSLDFAIGLPSNFILASLYTITLANEVGLSAGRLTFNFGDSHIYEEHFEDLQKVLKNDPNTDPVQYACDATTKNFLKTSLKVFNYNPKSNVNFKLKG